LAVDTQLIIGMFKIYSNKEMMNDWFLGGKRHEISAEDFIFAAIMLYLDVVYIFMYILMLVGKRE